MIRLNVTEVIKDWINPVMVWPSEGFILKERSADARRATDFVFVGRRATNQRWNYRERQHRDGAATEPLPDADVGHAERREEF
ncbi:MAG: hypothetical protein ACXWJB_10320 [Limisphaerales bacterium]